MSESHAGTPVVFTLPTVDVNRVLVSAVAYAVPRNTGMSYWVADGVARNATRVTRLSRERILRLTGGVGGLYRDCWMRMRLDLGDAVYRGDDRFVFRSVAAADFLLAAAWRWEAEQGHAVDAAAYWTHLLDTSLAPVLLGENHRSCTLRDMRWDGLYDRPEWRRFRDRLEGACR